ncbi:hypothetical protein G9A89_008032 [Geosiphon pyriformis]|nr:hypothetical protein G9A89_008032 [Geosiphon pyriformis]
MIRNSGFLTGLSKSSKFFFENGISPKLQKRPHLQRNYSSNSSAIKPNIKAPYNILFFGSDNFSLASLKALVDEKSRYQSIVNSLEVVVPPDRIVGRGLKTSKKSLAKIFAEEHGLRIYDAPDRSLDGWKPPTPSNALSFDIGIVVSFGYFLTPQVLSAISDVINVHPSLLPKYRGASPIQYAIKNGDLETGITLQEIHPTYYDAGRILKQITVPIPLNANYLSLEEILATKGAELLLDTLREFEKCKANAQEQDTSKVTRAFKIRKERSFIKWDKMTADRVIRLDRAISHQFPLRTTFNEKMIQLHDLFLPDDETLKHEPEILPTGTIIYDSKTSSLHIICAGGTRIGCRKVKMEKKNEISVKDWMNGYSVTSGLTKFGQ